MRYWILLCCLFWVWILPAPLSAQGFCGLSGTATPEIALPDVEQSTPSQAEIADILLAYFDAGGNVPSLMLAVSQSAPALDEYSWGMSVFKGNVVGTTEDDWVIDLKLYFGEREDSFMHGMVFALNCDDNRYQVLPVIEYDGHRGGGFLGAEAGVLAVVEMTDNATYEIVLNTIPNIGLHAYTTREYTIIGWDGAAFSRLLPYYEENREEGIPRSYSAATTFNASYEIEDTNGDLIPDLVLTSPQFQHHNMFAWSRLARGEKQIWTWDGTVFAVCSLAATPPQYRIQAIEDGNRALRCGNFNLAIIGYEQALSDETLLPWSQADNDCTGCDPDNPDTAITLKVAAEDLAAIGIETPDPLERDRLNAYAHYRLLLIYAALLDNAGLDMHWAALQMDYPDSPYAELAVIFYEQYQDEHDLEIACTAVKTYASEHAIFSPFIFYNYIGSETAITDETTGLYAEQDDLCPFDNPVS